MRVLRVLGIAENGAHLVCQDEEGGAENFALPLDERLRAAVRGDLSRFGQLEIEMEPQLRPKEIQSRIRAGATVEQVAAAAGCTPERIERYAYPVLLERSTMADRSRRAHPVPSAPGKARTLEHIVTATLADRGQQDPAWDAFRDERGWTVTVTWRAGRSENRAEWAYHAGPDGGSVTARNDTAAELLDPAPKPLRTIGDERPRQAVAAAGEGAAAGLGRGATAAPSVGIRSEGRAGPGAVAAPPAMPTRLQPDVAVERRSVENRSVENIVTDERSGALPPAQAAQAEQPAARTGTDGSSRPAPDTARSGKRGHRPAMPSWEDVLLGTRSPGH